MTAPDQTNAEVSDERLRELLPCPFCGGKAYLRQWSDAARVECTSHGPRSNDCGFTMRTYLNGAEAIAAWNRRSVTSQASEGEVAGWFWRWASSDEWRPLSRSGTEAGRADFVRDQEKIAPVVVAQLYLAPVSKRVEFVGDKRATTCLECAVIEAKDTLSSIPEQGAGVKQGPDWANANYFERPRLAPSHPAAVAVTDEMVEAIVQAVRPYTHRTLFLEEHRDLVRAALRSTP